MSALEGLVQGATGLPNYNEGGTAPAAINNAGNLLVAPALPDLAVLAARGAIWQVKLTTGLAALTALPTTTAGLSLYNNEPATGKSLIILSFGSSEQVIDATQADTTALFAMMNTRPVTKPTATALAKGSMNGKAYDGAALAVTTLSVTDEGWFPHGPVSPLAPAVAGANWKVNEAVVNGLYVVPPGGMFNIQAVKAAAAAAAAAQQFFFIRWAEVLMKFV